MALKPIPVAARSKAWVCGHSIVGTEGSNPADGMDVCLLWCVLSGGGLCYGPIVCPEESFRLWCVWVWYRNLNSKEALAHWGCRAMIKEKLLSVSLVMRFVYWVRGSERGINSCCVFRCFCNSFIKRLRVETNQTYTKLPQAFLPRIWYFLCNKIISGLI